MIRNKQYFGWKAAGAVVLTLFALGWTTPAQEEPKYHNYAEMTRLLQNLASAYPQLAKLETIGKTIEKRDLWVLQLAGATGAPVSERPALLIAANLEGDHLIGSEISCSLAEYILKNYAGNPTIKQKLDRYVIYVIPRVNPDAAEAYWAPARSWRRTNAQPVDEDNDGRIDENGPEDLNKDGVITVMRVKEPGGPYMVDPEEPRLMKKADPKKGEKGEYTLYREGVDRDQDGFIGEDPPGGVNINRNFLHDYPSYKAESGRHMASETETRALLDFLLAHRNIAALLTFGESDNLVSAPAATGRLGTPKKIDLLEMSDASLAEAGKVGIFTAATGRFGRFGGGEMFFSEEMMREFSQRSQAATAASSATRFQRPAVNPATVMAAGDVEYFRAVGARYAEMTGIRQTLTAVKPEGALFQYGYFQYGIPSFSTPGWGLAEAARSGGPPAGPGAATESGPGTGAVRSGTFAGRRMGGPPGAAAAAGAEGQAAESAAQAVDRQLLQWMDKEKIDGFVPWTRFQHPDLGEVEIGGFKPYAVVNPPAARIADLAKSHADFALYLTSLFPAVKIAKLEAAALGGGLFRIKAEVENSGVWPTCLDHAQTARAVKPTLVQLQVEPESILSGHEKSNSVPVLAGSGGRSRFEWLLQGKAGQSIELKVVSQKGGTDKRSVLLP